MARGWPGGGRASPVTAACQERSDTRRQGRGALERRGYGIRGGGWGWVGADGAREGAGYSGDLPGWSGRQARHGVQPASLAAARVIVSRSLSPMKRMRMQRALWYLGTPGTTVTSMAGSGPAGSAWPACLSTAVFPGTSVCSGSKVRSASEAGAGSPAALGLGLGAGFGSGAVSGSAVSSARDGAGFWVGWGDVGGAGVWVGIR